MKIYAGNLAKNVTEDDLRIDFECFGQVDNIEMKQGHALIYMPNDEQAKKAIDAIDGHNIKGMELEVHPAHAAAEHGSSSSKSGRSGYGSCE